MLRRLVSILAVSCATATLVGAPTSAAATTPAERFNAPGQRHANVCARPASTRAWLRFADATPTGFGLDNQRTFEHRPCTAGMVRLDQHERLPSRAGRLVFHRGGHGYDDAGNVKYGHIATADLATPLPAPVPSRGGRGAPCTEAAGQPAYRVQVRTVPWRMHYKHPSQLESGTNRGTSFEHYGDPAADQGTRRDIHYSYLLWSFVNVRGGGIVRALLEPGRRVKLCDVAPIRMIAWSRAGVANGEVVARYVKTMAGSCPLYGWMVWMHDYYPNDRGPLAHVRSDTTPVAADPPPRPDCPVQEPARPPGTTTAAASGVSDTAATLRASVDPAGAGANYSFEYGPAPGRYTARIRGGSLGFDLRPSRVAATIRGLQPATTYHYRVVAAGPHGKSHGADAAFTTRPPIPAPDVRGLRLAPVAFPAARKRTRKRTWIRWTASAAGKARFTFERRATGVRVRGSCKPAPRRRSVSRARRCGRWVGIAGSLRAPAMREGRNALRWSGWFGRRKLRPGAYRLRALPAGSDGRAGKRRHARFRIR